MPENPYKSPEAEAQKPLSEAARRNLCEFYRLKREEADRWDKIVTAGGMDNARVWSDYEMELYELLDQLERAIARDDHLRRMNPASD